MEDERRQLLRRLLELEGTGAQEKNLLTIYDEWLAGLPDNRTTLARRRYRRWLELVVNGQALGYLTPSQLTPVALIAWQNAVARAPTRYKRPRAAGSADQVRLALQACFSFAVSNGYMVRNFLLRGGGVPRLPGHDRKRQGAMTADKVAAVVKHLPFVDAAIFRHTWDTGARSSNIRCLRKSEVDRDASCLRVTGKGNKAIVILLTKQTLKEMCHFADISPSDYVYPNPLDPAGAPIPENTYYQRTTRAYAAAGIDQLSGEKPGRHHLRHGKAAETLERTGDITLVKRLLNHASINTTMRYAEKDEVQTRRLRKYLDSDGDE
jgi:integrase